MRGGGGGGGRWGGQEKNKITKFLHYLWQERGWGSREGNKNNKKRGCGPAKKIMMGKTWQLWWGGASLVS